MDQVDFGIDQRAVQIENQQIHSRRNAPASRCACSAQAFSAFSFASRKASLISCGVMAAKKSDAPARYGISLESTTERGGGEGAKAIKTVTNATAIITPRTTPNAPPSRRSNQERPTHLKNLASKRPTIAPSTEITMKMMKKPIRFAIARELT